MNPNFDEFRQGWRTVLGALIGVAFGMSAMGATYTLGLFVQPLSLEFGWSRGDILLVVLFMTLALMPAGPVVGWITDRVGVFRFIVLSQIAFGACFIAIGLLVHSLAAFYGLYIALALLGSGTLPITFGKLVAGRFTVHRGLALGIALCGTGVCALTVPPYASLFLDRFGWRAAYVALGVLPLVIALPASLFYLRDAEESLQQHSSEQIALAKPPLAGVRFWDAIQTYRFWAISAAFFLISGTATGVLTNLVPLLRDRGYDTPAAAATLSGFGIAVIIGRLGAGALVDRYWAPLIGFIFLALASLALFALSNSSLPQTATFLAVMTVGLATGMELDLSAYLAARYFGLKDFGQIYGVQFAVLLLGGGFAAPLFGRLYDRSGSYYGALWSAAAALAMGGVLLLSLGRYPVSTTPSNRGERLRERAASS